jgi:hypothetical protein
MPKLNYPQYSGVTPAITTTGHKLSNSPSHCGSYGKRLHSNSHTKFTSPVATPRQRRSRPLAGLRAATIRQCAASGAAATNHDAPHYLRAVAENDHTVTVTIERRMVVQ